MRNMAKKGHDWVLIILSLIMIIAMVLFVKGISGSLPSLDVIMKSESNGAITVTFTGISELIVAFACGVGLFIRITRKKK
jgi:hypothetical protein